MGTSYHKLAAALLLVTALGPRGAAAGATTRVEMKNVHYHVDERIVLHIRSLHGQLVPERKGASPSFDNKDSFSLKVDGGEIAISSAGLAELMNRYVFAYSGSPLKDIEISTEGNRIKQKGTLHKGIDIPFEIEGSLEPTPEGLIRLRTTSIRSAHIPVKGLMKLFGVKLAKLIKSNEARGVRLDKNDLILNPERMAPPPRIRGRVTAVRVEQDQVVQSFGQPGKPPSPPDPTAPNYMYYRGGTLRFGKLTMIDADLQILDSDPKDPFDFYLDRYNDQLVAGYSKNRPDYGLTVFMPDYHRIAKKSGRQFTRAKR